MKEPRSNSTKTLCKNFSTKMRNIDFNTYRAFKMVNEGDKVKRNHHEILKGDYNINKFPFGLKEERFKWQTKKNLWEKTELTGSLVKKSEKKEAGASWESLMDRTAPIPDRSNISNKSQAYKYELERNTKRTINPNLDISADNIRPYRKKENKSHAMGSIQNLMMTTPDVEPKYRKYAEKLTQGSEIFTPSKPNTKMRSKMPVDMEQIQNDKEFAGIKNNKKSIIKGTRSSSQTTKLKNLESAIFSKTAKNENNTKKTREYAYLNNSNKDINRSGPEIFNSSIILA